MSEDDGHEDKLIHRIIDEAVKNVFTIHFDLRELRPIVDYFESGQSVEVGDSLPSKVVLERIAKVPGLKKQADELAAKLLPDLSDREGREAAAAGRGRVYPRRPARAQQAQQVRQERWQLVSPINAAPSPGLGAND